MTYIQNVQIKTLNCRTGFLILTLYFQEDIGRANIALKAVSLLGVDPVQLSRYTHTHRNFIKYCPMCKVYEISDICMCDGRMYRVFKKNYNFSQSTATHPLQEV